METALQKLLALQSELASTSLQFGPCLPEAALAAFEQGNQLSLPTEYRLFPTKLGNGGAGPPAYGLQPLGATESWWHLAQRQAWQEPRALRQPFPFAKQWLWEAGPATDPAHLARVYNGSLYLGTAGCGMAWELIVSGLQRGYVWQFTDVGITPCRPALTFLDWYRSWLHHDTSSAEPFWWAGA